MSRLIQYMSTTETKDIDIIWGILTKDCMPFLKELKKSNSFKDKFFYRGYRGKLQYDIEKRKSRIGRRPSDTPENVSKFVDKEFLKKFGWKVRSEGIFTTGSKGAASGYGVEIIFFPIGKYKYIWSEEVTDLYNFLGGHYLKYAEAVLLKDDSEFLDHIYNYVSKEEEKEHIEKRKEEVWKGFIDSMKRALKTYQSNNMKDALISKSEVTFKCKEYYMVRAKYASELFELIEKL